MKCFILGGTGFLGEHVAKRLADNNHEVIVYNRQSERFFAIRDKYPKIKYIAGEFQHENNFKELLSGIDIVFHLISTTGPSNKDFILDVNSNIIPTIKLLDACVYCKVKKVIYFSSGGTVYGVPKVIPISEESELHPITSYGVQKLMIEQYLHLYQQMHGLKYVALRIANPYGVGQRTSGNQGVIAVFLSKVLLGEPIQIWGDSKIIRDFIYVRDVIDAVCRAIEYQGDMNVFNVAGGKGISLDTIITKIEKQVLLPIRIQRLPGRACDVPVNVLDISRAKRELNWYPRISLDDGIKKMCELWDEKTRTFSIE